MDVWKHFEDNVITHSAAHYLMAIDALLREQGYARVSDVARFLEVTTGSASVSLKTLKQRDLVTEDANRFLQLSPEGAALAHKIQVNKQMLVTLLHQVLAVPKEIAEIDACKIEHLLSDETRERLRVFLSLIKCDDAVAELLHRALNRVHVECPGVENCELCEDECTFHCVNEDEAPASEKTTAKRKGKTAR
ncbi:MAG: metal-dependent transcriptional regulator [Candidatus Sumerlaeia bacterium]|nr:metal-dependent transcriptional regulator [Candidatus Sumerlaeia bacterium]